MATPEDQIALVKFYEHAKIQFARLQQRGIESDEAQDRLGGWWRRNLLDFEYILNRAPDPLTAVLACQESGHFSFLTRFHDRPRIEAYCRWMTAFLEGRGFDLAQMPATVAESPLARADSIVHSGDGRALSPDFLRLIEMWVDIRGTIRLPDAPRIIELGGGYGGQARLAKLLYPRAQIVLVDLPMSLLFAYLFITLSFPDAKILLVAEESDIDKIDGGYDFVFLPSLFANRVRHRRFDLFVNTNSLSEMNDETVAFWFDFVQKGNTVSHLYIENRFLAFLTQSFRVNESACFFHMDGAWDIREWAFDPPANRCPYLMSLHPRTLRIVARRLSPEPSGEENRAKSDSLLNEVRNEDWYRDSRAPQPDGNFRLELGRYLEQQPRTLGIHVFDGTRNGTLYKLCEAVRLDRSVLKVYVLRQYLRLLSQQPNERLVFEEEQFLDRLLASLKQG